MTRLDSIAGVDSFASRHGWPACTGRCARGNCIVTVRRNQCCFATDAPVSTSRVTVAAAKPDAGSAARHRAALDPQVGHSQDSSVDDPLTQGAPSTPGTDPMDDAGRAASIRHREESYDEYAYEERYHPDTGRGFYDKMRTKYLTWTTCRATIGTGVMGNTMSTPSTHLARITTAPMEDVATAARSLTRVVHQVFSTYVPPSISTTNELTFVKTLCTPRGWTGLQCGWCSQAVWWFMRAWGLSSPGIPAVHRQDGFVLHGARKKYVPESMPRAKGRAPLSVLAVV